MIHLLRRIFGSRPKRQTTNETISLADKERFFSLAEKLSAIQEGDKAFHEDVAELIRLRCGQFQREFTTNPLRGLLEKLDEEQKREMIASGSRIFNEPAFKFMADYIINLQAEHTVFSECDMNKVTFGRATMNGVALIFEEAQRLDNLHKELIKPDEQFDRNAPI